MDMVFESGVVGIVQAVETVTAATRLMAIDLNILSFLSYGRFLSDLIFQSLLPIKFDIQ